jgi:hypothetical protein
VREDFGVIGDLEFPLICDDNVRVSSVKAEPLRPLLASFFDEGFRRRKTDFQVCELGLCGDVGVCMFIVGARVWSRNDVAAGMNGEGEDERTRWGKCNIVGRKARGKYSNFTAS